MWTFEVNSVIPFPYNILAKQHLCKTPKTSIPSHQTDLILNFRVPEFRTQQTRLMASPSWALQKFLLESYIAIMCVNIALELWSKFSLSFKKSSLKMQPKTSSLVLSSLQLLDWAVFSCGPSEALMSRGRKKVKEFGRRIIIDTLYQLFEPNWDGSDRIVTLQSQAFLKSALRTYSGSCPKVPLYSH